MDTVKVYNLKGVSVGEVSLPELFDATPNNQVLAQYARVFLANQRQGTRSTKDRSEVRGHARKPYKQKGTGNARHGSKKAPSMRGGGIAHGPRPQNFSLKMAKSMRTNALISALAKQKPNCIALDSAEVAEIKTKTVQAFLTKTGLEGKVLFITGKTEKNFVKSARNLQQVNVSHIQVLNAFEVMNCKNIVLEKSAIEMLAENHSKTKVKAKKEVKVKAEKVTVVKKTTKQDIKSVNKLKKNK